MSNEEFVDEIQKGLNVSKNMEELYEQNRGLIYEIAKKHSAYDELDDLMQEAYFGLHDAVCSYTKNGGANFGTYLKICVEHHLIKYLNDSSSLIRIPGQQKSLIVRYRKALEDYRKKYGTFPSNSDIAHLLQISNTKAEQLRHDAMIQNIDSLDRELPTEDDEMCLIDVIPDSLDRFEKSEEDIFQEQLSKVLWDVVEALEPMQRKVIELRFKHNMTYEEISQQIGKSRDRVRMLNDKALRSISKGHAAERLKSFLTYDRAYSLGLQATGLGTFRKTNTSSVERAVLKALEEEHQHK